MNFINQDILIKSVTKSFSTITNEEIETLSPGTTVKGRIRPFTMQELYLRDKSNFKTTHRLYSTTSCSVYDRVYYDKDYRVVSVVNPMSMSRFYQIDLEVVE